MQKIGLVLEGDSFNSLYVAGIIDKLLESSIKIDMIISSSVSTLCGINYFSNQKGRVINYIEEAMKNKKLSININDKGSLSELFRSIAPFNSQAFVNTKKDYYTVLTDADTGEAEYVKITNPRKELDVIQASYATPLKCKPLKIEDKKYLTGTIVDPIPYKKLKELGCQKIIIVESEPMNYRKRQYRPLKEKLIKIKYYKNKELVNKILQSYKVYNNQAEGIIDLEKEGQVYVIRPLRRLKNEGNEKESYRDIYNLGYTCCTKELKAIQNFLNKKK